MKKASVSNSGRRVPATRKAALAVALAALAFATPAMAQDSFSIDEDDMFGSEDMVETVTESAAGSAVQSLLVSESVRVGGRFTGSAAASWTWNDPWEGGFDIAATDDYGLVPSLSSLLYFDARPTEESRFYGSVKSSWPFATSTSVLTDATFVTSPASVTTTSTTLSLPDIEVFELFSDFSWNDSLYFRFGKQTVNWGVGYFFSPANILNLQVIDPTDPTAQLEGPVALRALYSIPGTQHNIWAYTVFDSATMKPEDTAVAAKAEFVFGGWELGVGGYYQKDDPIRGMLTAVGSVGQFSVFGEATIARGSDRTWVTSIDAPTMLDPIYLTTEEDKESLFFQGTAGFRYTNSDANITVMGQYLYDGEGYSNADREARIAEAQDNETAIKDFLAAMNPTADVDAAFSGFLKGLIYGSGQHYAAATFSKSELLLDDLSFSLFAMGNLSDFSGYIKPTLSYSFFDGLSLSTSASFAVGYDNGEYVVLNDGQALSLSISLTLGSGAF